MVRRDSSNCGDSIHMITERSKIQLLLMGVLRTNLVDWLKRLASHFASNSRMEQVILTERYVLPLVRLTRRCSGGREAQFSCVLSMSRAAPLNASVRRLTS